MKSFCIYKKHQQPSYDSINICIHFVQFVHMCMYIKHKRQFQLASCIGFVQFVHCLFVQKNIHFKFKTPFSLLFVHVLYSLFIFCIYVGIQCIYFLHSLSYYFLYICRNSVNIFFAFTIILFFVYMQEFNVYIFYIHYHTILICTILVYKIYTNVVFCNIFLYILYSFCTNFLVSQICTYKLID